MPPHPPIPPKCRPIQPKQPVSSAFHPMGLQFGGHTPLVTAPQPPNGGMTPSKAPTRRRHAVRRLRMAQNPHYRPNRGHPMACWARTHRLRQPCVTNVVKLAHFETPFNSLCYKRRQSEPKNQYFQRKRRRIDDVCNKTQAGPPNRRPPRGLRGQAVVPVGGGRAWPGFEATHKHTSAHRAPLVWRAPEGPEGTGGLRVDAPSEARGADGSRAGRRPRAHKAARPHKAHAVPGTPAGPHAAPRRPACQRVGRLAAPHPSSTPVNQPQ